jgi:hypothetical protein
MSDEIQETNKGLSLEQPGLDAQPAQRVEREGDSIALDSDSIVLALRFLVGLLALGGDEAARRLQEMQRKLDEDPALWNSESPAGTKTLRRQAWHLGVGLMRRGQRRLRRSYDLSVRTAGRVSSASARWGGRLLARPVRRPIEERLAQWRKEAALIEIEGEIEEQKGRALATGTLATLILEILDEVAENPQMLDFVQALLGQQGMGMAESVMDNARSLTLTADDAADGLLRWLLRRTPRRELPPSPVEGQSQTMYAPTARVEGGAPDVD